MKKLTLSIFILTVLPSISFAQRNWNPATVVRGSTIRTMTAPPRTGMTPAMPTLSRFTPAVPTNPLQSIVGPATAYYVEGSDLELTNFETMERVDLSGISSINSDMFYRLKSLQSPMTHSFLKNFPQLESVIAVKFNSPAKANQLEDALGSAFILAAEEAWDPETKQKLEAMRDRYADPAIMVDETETKELIDNCTMN